MDTAQSQSLVPESNIELGRSARVLWCVDRSLLLDGNRRIHFGPVTPKSFSKVHTIVVAIHNDFNDFLQKIQNECQ